MITHQQNRTCNKIAVKKNLQLFIKKSLVVFGLTSLIIGGISGFSSIASINNIKSQAASPSYTTSNKKFFRDGQEIVLKGVNWFGFETDNAVFHGLWTNRSANTQLDQMKSLGFNAIRVPVCPGVLTNKAIGGVDYSANPDLNGLNSQQALDLLMNKISAKGMYILLDHHRPDCNAISEYWYTSGYSETQWIGDLKSLATRYASNPNFVGIDIKNEPHGPVSWSEWKGATERAGQAILGVNPNIVIYTEGVSSTNAGGNCNSGYNAWWGGNIKGQLCDPISTAAIPANKLAFAPHVYGPDVYAQPYFNDTTFANMPAIWDDHFGSVQAAGNSVAFGEFGGKYGGGDPRDVAWQNKIVDYQIAKGMCSFFFWSWNPNSGDTGGILNDDWTTVSTAKYNNLKRLIDAPACQGGSVPVPASSTPTSSSANSVSSSPNSSSAGVSSSISSSIPANSACYQVSTNRQMGGDNWYNLELSLKNTSQITLNNWELSFDLPAFQTVQSSWNNSYSQNGRTVKVTIPGSTIVNNEIKNLGGLTIVNAQGTSNTLPTVFNLTPNLCPVVASSSSSSVTTSSIASSVASPVSSSSQTSSTPSSSANSVSSSPNSSSAGVSSSISSSIPANSACYQVSTNRQMGGDNWYNLELSLKNTSQITLNNWELSFDLPAFQTVQSSWNNSYSQNGRTVKVTIPGSTIVNNEIKNLGGLTIVNAQGTSNTLPTVFNLTPNLCPVVASSSSSSVTTSSIASSVASQTPSSTSSVATAQNGTLKVKVNLQGAYNRDTGLMRTDLRNKNLINSDNPYDDITPADPNSLPPLPSNAVDWVNISLRKDGVSVISSDNGAVLLADGTGIMRNLAPGKYQVTMRHRNHLAITTNTDVDVVAGQTTDLDFTTNQNVKGGNQALLMTGVFGMKMGNANGSTAINSLDRILVRISPDRTNVYSPLDINMDGNISSIDRILARALRDSLEQL